MVKGWEGCLSVPNWRGFVPRHQWIEVAYYDRNNFEIIAYSYGPDDGSEYRRRIANDCDRFPANFTGLLLTTPQQWLEDKLDNLGHFPQNIPTIIDRAED